MVKWLMSFILIPWSAYAAEGMITVLEAPFFREPTTDSSVIQYVRKGDTIYLHASVLNEDESGEFLRTKDKQGRDAWILRSHVHVWYEDYREAGQRTPRPDPTDYRLQEPLPERYPIADLTGLRGWVQVSLATPWTANYPYNEKVTAQGYGQQFEFATAVTWQREKDETKRWFVGGIFAVRTSIADYVMINRRAEERWLRVGAGPLFSYDPYRAEKYRLTLYTSVLAYPYTTANIRQEMPGVGSDQREYWGWNVGGRAGLQWQRLKLFPTCDLVLGVWGEVESPLAMQSRLTGKRPDWWEKSKGDTFNTGVNTTLAAQIGIQSSY